MIVIILLIVMFAVAGFLSVWAFEALSPKESDETSYDSKETSKTQYYQKDMEYYLCKYGINYSTYNSGSDQKNYIMSYNLPHLNIYDIGIRIAVNYKKATQIVGYNFYSSSDYIMENLVNNANNDYVNYGSKGFSFYIDDTGDGDEVIIQYGEGIKRIALADGMDLYDHYCLQIQEMTSCIVSFLNNAHRN